MSDASQLKEFRIAEAIVISPNALPEWKKVPFNHFDWMCEAEVEYPNSQESEISRAMFFNLHMADRALPKEEQNLEARKVLQCPSTKFMNMQGAMLKQILAMVVDGPAYVILEEQSWKAISFAAESTLEGREAEQRELEEHADLMIEPKTNYAIWWDGNTFFLALQDEKYLELAKMTFC